jgi:hypothetical protein
MSENETREEEERKRNDAEGGNTYAHRTTTIKRISFSFLFLSMKYFQQGKKKKECHRASASYFIF